MRSGGKEKIHSKILFSLKIIKLVNSSQLHIFSYRSKWEKSEIFASSSYIRKLQQDQEKITKTNKNQIKYIHKNPKLKQKQPVKQINKKTFV